MDNKFKDISLALTFDDVLLVPNYSQTLPAEVDTLARLSKTIDLRLPLIAAPMDTVTEANLAIALALEGGIGIVHKNLSIERQRKEIDKVKRHVTGMIVDPITISANQTVGDALRLVEKYGFTGFPVTDGEEKLVGILSNRDIRFIDKMDVKVADVMTTAANLVTAPKGVTLDEAKKILQQRKVEKLLFVDNRGDLTGLMTIKDIEKTLRHPNATKDDKGRLRVGAAVGVGPDCIERAQELVKFGCDILVVDTAHGHTKIVLDTVRELKSKLSVEVIAGNVATKDGTRDLIDAGADVIKVGIGPGSICTTRIVAGVGVPQITAVNDCANEAAKDGIPVIADGGIKHSGDIVKAIAAGATTVMIGSLFAGVEESPGEKILFQGRVYKEYRGMGSIGAMSKGSADRYFQDGSVGGVKLVPEGVEGRVPHKGELGFVVHQMIGGLRSGMGYCGAANLDELREKSRFVRISSSGLKESHVHDVQVTKEAPNYSQI